MVGGIGTVNGELFGPRGVAGDRRLVRLHGPRRHAGHAEPPQEGPPVRAVRAAAPADRVLHRGRRRTARRHRRHRAHPASTAWRSSTSPSCRAWCRSSASTPGTASPATPRILGCCDVVIATEDSNIGMGGPAMIEGGGLGVYEPTAIGPIEVQRANGVVDIVVADEAEGVARRQAVPVVLPGPGRPSGSAPTRCCCATSIPEDRKRSYDVRTVIDAAVRHRLGARAAPRLRARDGHRAGPARGAAGRCDSPTTRRTSPAPSTRRAPTRRRGSCSCATRSTSRSSRCATRPG